MVAARQLRGWRRWVAKRKQQGDLHQFALSGGRSLLYGLINALLGVPALYGYAAVIFKAPAFQSHSAHLAKAVVLSSAVHQMVFSLRSSLPFAIGQVQDAGLIFLSKMAMDMADQVAIKGGDDDVTTTTALFGLAISTVVLGLVLVCLGKARLTSIVSFLPMPVLGGYLAFIGFFCCEAGIGLCIGESLMGPRTWPKLWEPPWRLVLALPGVLGGAFLCQVSRMKHADALLPLAMVLLPCLFYVVVYCIPGYDLEDAVRDGWLSPPVSHPATAGELFALYDVRKVQWSAIPVIIPEWCSMVLVVAFSSCLDVAAIEIDLGEPLDMDEELKTVGISNVVSGCLGGFTGSYIFSQTIFTCRSKARSRLVGLFIVISEVGVVLAKVDIVATLPLYFFSATLTFVGIDLLHEWLWEVRFKFAQKRELAALWATFIAIHLTSLNTGLLIGCAASSVEFMASVVQHSHQPRRVVRTSHEPRNAADSRKLAQLRHRLVVLELSGFVWWGTATSLLAQIRRALPETNYMESLIKDDDDDDDILLEEAEGRRPSLKKEGSKNGSFKLNKNDNSQVLLSPVFLTLHRARGHTSHSNERSFKMKRGSSEKSGLLGLASAETAFRRQRSRVEDVEEDDDLTSWVVVLDFRRVESVDASSVRSCFAPLARDAERRGFGVAFAAVGETHHRLMQVHGVVKGSEVENVRVFQTMDEAIRWSEARQLRAKTKALLTLPNSLRQIPSFPPGALTEEKAVVSEQSRRLNPMYALVSRKSIDGSSASQSHERRLQYRQDQRRRRSLGGEMFIPGDFKPPTPRTRTEKAFDNDTEAELDRATALVAAAPDEKKRTYISSSLEEGNKKTTTDSGLSSAMMLPLSPHVGVLGAPMALSLGAARFVARLLGRRDDGEVISALRRSLRQFSAPQPTRIYSHGEPSTEFYCVLTGECSLEYPKLDLCGAANHAVFSSVEIVRPGGFFGYVDLSLKQPRTSHAKVPSAATVLVLSIATLEGLAQIAPLVAVQLQTLILRCASRELSNR